MPPVPQLDPYAVVIRLRVQEPVDLALTQRQRKQPSYEFARCRGSCDIAIRPGSYLLEVGDSEETRAGVVALNVSQAGTYRLTPSARDSLLPGALLAAIGPGVMGAGIGIAAANADNNDASGLYWAGAGTFAAGGMLTGLGYFLYADRPRITFEEGVVPRESAVEVTPTVVPGERELAYREDLPVPPGYRVRREPRRGLLTTGLIMFGASYGIMAGIGAAALVDDDEQSSENARLLVPIIGPVLMPLEDEDSRGSLILFGAGPQAAGLALIMAGVMSERQTLVPDTRVSVTPVLAPGTAGVVVGGQL